MKQKLKGYEVVYYHNGYRLSAGNKQIFPEKKAAENYKQHWESYPWMKETLFVEEVEYEGEPLSPYKMFNGRKITDQEHYFGLDACREGDLFSQEMIDHFDNMLPAACRRFDCFQIGEPATHEDGKALYPTFKKIAPDVWEYCGNHIRGEK